MKKSLDESTKLVQDYKPILRRRIFETCILLGRMQAIFGLNQDPDMEALAHELSNRIYQMSNLAFCLMEDVSYLGDETELWLNKIAETFMVIEEEEEPILEEEEESE